MAALDGYIMNTAILMSPVNSSAVSLPCPYFKKGLVKALSWKIFPVMYFFGVKLNQIVAK